MRVGRSAGVLALYRLLEPWVSVVMAMAMVMANLRIKAWVGLGRFVLQSYEKSELEVEPGRTGHTARCKVPSHQKHRRQSSRKLLYTEAKAKVSLFVPSPLTQYPCMPLTLPRREIKAHRIHPHTSHSIVPVLEKRSPTINSLVSARVPDVLEEAVPLGEAVHAVVALAHGADEAAKSVDLVLASVTAVLVNLGDGDLDRAVVLGLDDAVGRAALAGDVPAQRKITG